jgi:hypothetical protein
MRVTVPRVGGVSAGSPPRCSSIASAACCASGPSIALIQSRSASPRVHSTCEPTRKGSPQHCICQLSTQTLTLICRSLAGQATPRRIVPCSATDRPHALTRPAVWQQAQQLDHRWPGRGTGWSASIFRTPPTCTACPSAHGQASACSSPGPQPRSSSAGWFSASKTPEQRPNDDTLIVWHQGRASTSRTGFLHTTTARLTRLSGAQTRQGASHAVSSDRRAGRPRAGQP